MTRYQLQIMLGIIFFTVTSVILLVYGFTEEQRMATYAVAHEAEAIEVGASLFEQQCSRCHGPQGQGIPNLCPPLNDRAFFDNRLAEVGWSGTLEDYIVATASSGRLASTRPAEYPGGGTPAMPSFADEFGGPLREDQIRSIATFIMNWEATAGEVEAPPTVEGPTVGEDITQELPEGNAESGEVISEQQGCIACHITAPTGPSWVATDDMPGIGTRAALRIEQPDYTGNAETPEQYLFESIVRPEAFLVEGYADIMPHTYSETLSPQNVADLIAYMLTLE